MRARVSTALALLLLGAAPAAPGPAPPAPPSGPSCPAPAQVTAVDATTWRVPRAALRAFHSRRACLRALGRAVPVSRDGRPLGLALRNLPAGGFVEALGLREGDVLLRVAGLPVHSPELALTAYALALSSQSAEVVLERAGQPRTHRYLLQD
jgi:type II secretory pathway component PulC